MAKQRFDQYDAIVIGGGHNGLVYAAYIGRMGMRVLVLEQRSVLGGACVTETIAGCMVSRTSYVYSLFHPKIVRDLELKRHGLELLERDPPSFTPLKNGRHLLMYQDMKRTQEEIAKFSKADAEAYPKYEEVLDKIARFTDPMLLMTPPDPLNMWDWPKLLAFGKRTLGLGKDLYTLADLFSSSAYDFTKRWFESEPLLSTLCTDGIIGTVGGPYTPGTAYVLLHHVMGEVNGHRGRWGYVRGGMGGLSQAIASAGREHGVEFRLNADVRRIVVEKGQVRGVELVGGEVVMAPIVASSADPHQTFVRMLQPDELPADFLSDIKKIDYSSATAKVNFVLNGPLKFMHYDGPVPGTFHICEDSAYIERAFDDAKWGRISFNLVLEGCVPSTVDDTLVPHGSGKHVLSVLVQYVPYTLASGEWDDAARDTLLRRTIGKLAEYTNIRDIIEATDVLTPVDLERDFRLTGGNLFHGSMGLRQLFLMRPIPGWAKYRTPIKGLYLCGSGAHPGGGVTGLPGHNAARETLRYG